MDNSSRTIRNVKKFRGVRRVPGIGQFFSCRSVNTFIRCLRSLRFSPRLGPMFFYGGFTAFCVACLLPRNYYSVVHSFPYLFPVNLFTFPDEECCICFRFPFIIHSIISFLVWSVSYLIYLFLIPCVLWLSTTNLSVTRFCLCFISSTSLFFAPAPVECTLARFDSSCVIFKWNHLLLHVVFLFLCQTNQDVTEILCCRKKLIDFNIVWLQQRTHNDIYFRHAKETFEFRRISLPKFLIPTKRKRASNSSIDFWFKNILVSFYFFLRMSSHPEPWRRCREWHV